METLTKVQKDLLTKISESKVTEKFYLAGGTGLTLHLQHRPSEDFDFFSTKEFDVDKYHRLLSSDLSNKLVLADRQTLIVNVSGISVSFMCYPHELLEPPKKHDSGVYLAGITDITTMKLSTIGKRGAKRDFVDVYIVATEKTSLEKLLEAYQKRFASSAADRYHILRSLTYFADAEDDPMPRMEKKVSWDEIKKYFEREAKKLLRPS